LLRQRCLPCRHTFVKDGSEALFEIVPKSPRVSSPLLLEHLLTYEEYLLLPGPSMEHKKVNKRNRL